MHHRSLQNLHTKAKRRPEGYLADVLAHASEVNEAEGWYTLTDYDFRTLRKRWTPKQERRKAFLKKRWRGPGDVVEWLASLAGFKAAPGCGCKSWKKKFNRAGWLGWWKLIPAWITETRKTTQGENRVQ